MAKTIGWAASEIIAIGLVNVTSCETCGRLINYNGSTPKFCLKCRPSPEADPGNRDQFDQRLPGEEQGT